jgi:ABC-2 type transport system ATP-binding protein
MASGSLEELTASFKEKEGVVIKLKKGGKNILSLLQKIHGVDKVSAVGDELKIEWTKGKDVRDEITKLIVDKELGLIEMRPLAMNIEDLYLKVISGGVEQ